MSKLKDMREANFNSHAHVERDKTRGHRVYEGQNFNSHAHVERDHCGVIDELAAIISTHTLTWSVTFHFGTSNASAGDFNSHAHVERDT